MERTGQPYMINTIAADDLVAQGTRASTAMNFMFSRLCINLPVTTF